MPYRRNVHTQMALCLVAVIIGCGDDELTNPPPVPMGTLAVSTASVGSAIDADGYTVLLDGDATGTIGASDSVAADVAVGQHEVELIGLADNCGVIGDNPVGVTVVEDEATTVDFSVACPPFFDYIAFPNLRDGVGYLSAMKPDGSELIDLAVGSRYRYPAWAPEASRIAFEQMTCADWTCEPSDLYVLDIADQSVTRLTHDGSPSVPTWSPDGTRIAYGRWGDIHVINLDGTDPVVLTSGSDVDGDPAWSPDGTEIAFIRSQPGEGNDIWVVGADGSSPRRITNVQAAASVWEPAWSPAGSRIAFVHAEFGSEGIWTMNADGSDQILVAAGYNWRPTWSPDGTQIAYESSAGIAVMNADGSGIVEYPGGFQPAWSPSQ